MAGGSYTPMLGTSAGGGGAGKGCPYINADQPNSYQPGGEGRVSDITGDAITYAGGGAGGAVVSINSARVAGGQGGGGTTDFSKAAFAGSGVDGLGGGGAGASYKTGTTDKPGNGGSGVVVLRLQTVGAWECDHSETKVTKEKKDPTCTEDGWTAEVTCAKCEKILEECTPLTRLGHDFTVEKERVPPTSDTDGYVIWGCSHTQCGCTETKRETLPHPQAELPTEMPAGATAISSGDISGIAWSGAAKAWQLGNGDAVIVFTDAENDGTFTVSADKTATVNYLAVGGGGAGGFGGSTDRIGAGGGAGGFCAGTDLALASGDYAIGVGAGGVPTTDGMVRGQNGGDSFVKCAGTDLVRAIGGGAGGNGGFGADVAAGAAGGCGGGGADDSTGVGQAGGSGVEGQGFAGGRAADGTDDFLCRNGGGGGGAGAVGSNSVDTWKGGDGGCGLNSQITGHDVWYAGGGAGGVTTWNENKSVAGGKGGGGSVKSDTVSNPNEVYAENGVDTLGGGGAASTGANLTPVAPGRGGNGVVVIRVTKIEDVETPQEESPSVEGGEKIDFEKDMTDNTKVNSSKTVIFPRKPEVSGNAITYGGKTVEMPAYYKVTVVEAGGAWKLSLVLDAEAVRPEVDAAVEKPFVVDSEKVTLAIDNVKPNLYYGIESVTTLGPAAKWTPGTAVKGSELKDGSQLEANRPAGSDAAFFRVYVTDVPQKSN